MRTSWLSSTVPLLLAAIGTALLIYSWVYEKGEMARALDDVNRLQRSQLVIGFDEIARDQWFIALNQEFVKEKPNKDLLAAAAHGAVVNLLKWQSHMEQRVTSSPEQ